MKLSSLLDEKLIFWNENFDSYQSIYEVVSKKIASKFSLNETAVFDAIMERDKLGHTILPNNTAIPHGRLDNLNDVIIAVVKNNTRLKVEDNEVDFLFILMTGKVGSNLYLKTLASISGFVMKYLKEAKELHDGSEFIKFVEKTNIEVTKPLKVRDIMRTEFQSVLPDDLITVAVDRMKKTNRTFLPILQENGTFIGKVSFLDILKVAYPDYLMMMPDLAFVTNLRAFEDFERLEKVMKVKEVITIDNNQVINCDSTIIEMGFQMVKRKAPYLFAVDNQMKLVGIIDLKTVLDSIIRA